MTLTNSTFAYNFASTGGAVYTIGFGTASFTNCTIAANVATTSPFSEAGGIYVGIGRHTVQLKNTLVALNWADSNPDVAGEFASLGHNLIGDASGASGFTKTDILGSSEAPIDPRLGPLQDNGGPTHTMALLKGSIAIDAGDSKGAPDVDQRGEFRDDFVDIGAYEFQEE
jgi:hypothetical protein